MKDSFKTFEMDYSTRIRYAAGSDIQFGMDFKLTQKNGYALCQLIFPACSVGNNKAGKWNIDNHKSAGSLDSLIFENANNGTITDIPTEISHPNMGTLTTTFVVFIVNLTEATINREGVTFGYSVDTSSKNPQVIYSAMKGFKMTPEQKTLITQQCNFIKYI